MRRDIHIELVSHAIAHPSVSRLVERAPVQVQTTRRHHDNDGLRRAEHVASVSASLAFGSAVQTTYPEAALETSIAAAHSRALTSEGGPGPPSQSYMPSPKLGMATSSGGSAPRPPPAGSRLCCDER
jgi:hypothetical protein